MLKPDFNLRAYLIAPSFNFLHLSSFSEISVSYKTPSSQRRHFATHLKPTVNVTAHCNTLAAVERPHELYTIYRLADKIISKDMSCTCVIVYCLEGLRVRTVRFEGKNLLQEINRPVFLHIYIPAG